MDKHGSKIQKKYVNIKYMCNDNLLQYIDHLGTCVFHLL